MSDHKKLWSGRFQGENAPVMEDFHSSIRFDWRLFRQDIAGSIAHARMLGRQGIIAEGDSEAIIGGLNAILRDIESGELVFDQRAEDIHMFIESELTKRIGEAGKRLHTGRSRNDQVALDFRMYVKDSCEEARACLTGLMAALISIAEENLETIMPGYTHMQRAQPITLAHHMMAYFEMFKRDRARFDFCRDMSDEMPLGAGALAGTTYPLDRESVANELGFGSVTKNSLDSVSDRDFALDFLYSASVTMMHLSRFCEEIITWATGEFGYVELPDAYSTGSSIMPQKKNPDAAELVRGKAGRVFGDLAALLTVMKGLPLAYNKDMQEDKEALFDARDTLFGCLSVFTPMLKSLVFRRDSMERSAGGGFANATDAADYLVKKGLPFREAHEVIGKMVLHCQTRGIAIDEMNMDELKSLSGLIGPDFYEAVSLRTCVGNRKITGGPSPEAVKTHMDSAKAALLA